MAALGSVSLGIYLIHSMIGEQLASRLRIDDSLIHLLVGIALMSILTIIVSLLGVRIRWKIPLVGRIVR